MHKDFSYSRDESADRFFCPALYKHMQMVNHQTEPQYMYFKSAGPYAEYCEIDKIVRIAIENVVSFCCSLIDMLVFSFNKFPVLHILAVL